MLRSQIPAKFNIPFANSAGPAYTRSVPQASQIGIQNGAASLTDGFPPLCFVPQTGGGVPPFGADFNGLLNQITAWNRWNAAGGVPVFDAGFAAQIGGYPAGAILQNATSPYSFWVNQADNNSNNPDSGGTNWTGYTPGGGIALTPSTGSANAQVVTATPFTLGVGTIVRFIAGFDNTGALQINVNGRGLENVVAQTVAGVSALAGGEVQSGDLTEVGWDGTQWQLLNSASPPVNIGTVLAGSTPWGALYDNNGKLGVTAAGAAGSALIANGSAAPTWQLFAQPISGAVNRPWNSKASDVISVLDLASGVDPSGVADSTVGINNAITRCPVGATLFFPPGNYKVGGTLTALSALTNGAFTNNCIIPITKAIRILGAGQGATPANSNTNTGGTTFTVAAASNADLFAICGQHPSILGGSFEDFGVSITSNCNAPFHFMAYTSGGLGFNMNYHLVRRISCSALGNAQSILAENGGALTAAAGGVFANGYIEDCIFESMRLVAAGDTIRILGNLTGGVSGSTHEAFHFSNQNNGGGNIAGACYIFGNNIIGNSAGSCVLGIGLSMYVACNEITGSPSSGFVLDLGSGGTCQNPTVLGNEIGGAIRVNSGCVNAYIDGNWIGGSSNSQNSGIATVFGLGNFWAAAGAGTNGGGPGLTNLETTSNSMIDMRRHTPLGTYTLATLPTGGIPNGWAAMITDGQASPTWGASNAGGGSRLTIMWWNGSTYRTWG